MLAHTTIERPPAIHAVQRAATALTVRRTRAGRFLVLRSGHVLWRSTGSYPNDGAQVALGTHSLAFATQRAGVYLTDLSGPERVVATGRSLHPLAISAEGDLLVTGRSRIRVISSTGKLVRSYGYRTRNGFAFDDRTGTLVFVTPNGRLASGAPRSVLSRRPVPLRDGWLSLTPGRLLVLGEARELVLARRDGSVVARAAWPAAAGSSDSGYELAPDGHAVAFRVSTAHPGDASGTAAVYVLRAGATRARLVYRDHFGTVGCGVSASMRWRGDDLLYRRSGSRTVAIDTRARADPARLSSAPPWRSAAMIRSPSSAAARSSPAAAPASAAGWPRRSRGRAPRS